MKKFRNKSNEYIKPMIIFLIGIMFLSILSASFILYRRFRDYSLEIAQDYVIRVSQNYILETQQLFFNLNAVANFVETTMEAYKYEANEITFDNAIEMQNMILMKSDLAKGVRILYDDQSGLGPFSLYLRKEAGEVSTFHDVFLFDEKHIADLTIDQNSKIIGPWTSEVNGYKDNVVTLAVAVFNNKGERFATIGVDVLQDQFDSIRSEDDEIGGSILILTSENDVVSFHIEQNILQKLQESDTEILLDSLVSIRDEMKAESNGNMIVKRIIEDLSILIVTCSVEIVDGQVWSIILLLPLSVILNSLNTTSQLILYISLFSIILSLAVFWVYRRTHNERYIDALTGLYNRHFLKKKAIKILQHQKHYGRPISLIMCDIDKFKRINDTYGHMVGDIVLKQVAEILQVSIRKNDYVARFGGEEFVVCLVDTDLKVSQQIAERIRSIIERETMKTDRNIEFNVTISMGIAASDSEKTYDYETLLRKADSNLYTAKESGRNRVIS